MYCLSIGIFILVPHLFYIPIILVAYQYPERAVVFTGALSAAYFAEVLFFSRSLEAEFVGALIRVIVFLLVAIVISNLSRRLQARESRYRGIFETSGAGIFLFSARTGEIAEMNPGCSVMLGYQKDEALALEVSAIWPGYSGLAGALEEGRIEGLDCNLTARDGAIYPVLLSASLLPDQETVCAVVTDMKEQKRMENLLRRSEETLRVILNATDVGILLTDPGREVVEANAAAVRFFGAAGREDLIGQNPDGLVARRDLGVIRTYREQILCGEALAPIECMFRRLDGTERLVEATLTCISQGGGAPGRMVISFRDITERRRAEEAMREENRHLAIINEVMEAATASRRLDEILPVSLERVTSLLDFEMGAAYLVHPGEDTVHLRASVGDKVLPTCKRRDDPLCRHVFVDGEARFVDWFGEEYPGHTDLGIRSFAAVPIPGDNGTVGCIAVASRIREMTPETERQILTAICEKLGSVVVKGMLHEDLEAALTSANRYLEKANAAAAEVNLYVDILTHDINNANTIAMGYLQMYLEFADKSEGMLIEKSLAAVYQSSEVIRNVLTLRKIRTGPVELRPMQLEPVIQGMRNYYADTSITREGPDVAVLADDLIGVVFANLIGNSTKFGGSDVEVTISIREEEDGMVSVTVADTGPGIPDDLKPRLFERSQRGSTTKSGKGLGLYIVRMLVERYGGSVRAGDRVPGRPEKGAAITVTLPRCSPVSG